MTTLKRGNQQTDGIISGELSNGRIRPRNAVILRQRSPWQSQGLPTKGSMHFADATTNEGCPIFRVLCERWEGPNPCFHRTKKPVPCPSRVLCERAGLLTDGKIGTWAGPSLLRPGLHVRPQNRVDAGLVATASQSETASPKPPLRRRRQLRPIRLQAIAKRVGPGHIETTMRCG
jgi:hypothetical protein